MLNVSFLVPSMRRNFGGCAGNIAFNLGLLGGQWRADGHGRPRFRAVPPLAARMQRQPRARARADDEFTAQAFITTDLDDNQITAFHPGCDEPLAPEHGAAPTPDISLGVVAPDGRDGMLAHATQFAAAGIPWLFDPGPGPADVRWRRNCGPSSTRRRWVAVNDYEGEMLQQRTGLTRLQIAATRRGLYRHEGRRRQRDPCGWTRIPGPDGAGRSRQRPDRLRRRLSRRAAFSGS